MRYFKIYKITNLINNKIYIGQTNGKSKYYFGGGKLLNLAVNKYGKENFKMEAIFEGVFNDEFIDYLEKHYIQLYNSRNKNIGYNLESGGNKQKELSELTKKLISKSKKGSKHSEGTKLKMSKSHKGLNTWSKGKNLSEEHKEKVSKALKGKKYNLSQEQRDNISKRSKSRIVSEETKIKMSLAKKGKPWTEARIKA